ncbi:mannose-1-phosphate guanylyltransferase [Pseudoalteromonas luteoviolacea]|uniref:Mannose-1-phosphate guanylyltransferase n=1 Tax=Pseudoalteromonas luteoviolacea TaxID=43657 RepID=A0A0C1MKY5_9GAMM|nr:nucleotidyltransferase family protein [Pseudoalteromonas luteoviolacea]KID57724.1 mannose-1-phosphate guanylyltransferase [Pseudoalteromonas luteoviolacea]
MKAILLAAGLGTRLRPITDSMPKCLVPINGRPLLDLWIEKLINLGVDDILINTHYFSEQVELFIHQHPHKANITVVREQELLGTGGTLIANAEFWRNETTLIIHADNYCHDTLDGLMSAHKNRPSHSLATLLLFETPTPEQCGIVELSKEGVVHAFHEKIPNPPSNLASGALFVFSEQVYSNWLSHFKSHHFYEISLDFVPLMIGNLYTYKTNEIYVDIGTPTAYNNLQSQLAIQNAG